MIDTHTHLYDSRFDEDLGEVFSRAQAVGVTHYIIPDVDSSDREALERLVCAYPCCLPTVGLHPTSVNDNPLWREEMSDVARKLSLAEFDYCAIGEAGLDLYWSRDYLTEQIEALTMQLELAVEYDLPIILHVRDSWAEIFSVLEPFTGRVRGVFHSFSGSLEDFHRIVSLGGFMVGLGGTITYKNSKLVDVVPHIPLENILLETDSPYLPPVPYRGNRNESSYLMIISEKIAQLQGVSGDLVRSVTTQNAMRMFDIG
ncbi:MAG: TatD family hydrolase [Rikenellaceae bacterium]